MTTPLLIARRALVLLAGVGLLAFPAAAQDGDRAALRTVLEDFEDGVNDYDITMGIPQAEVIAVSGGNPGRWLRNAVLNTFVPSVSTRARLFTGDFVARGARAFRLDAQTVSATFGVQERPFTLILTTFNGQPSDPDAWDYVYFRGPLVPQAGEGWRSYTYLIPSRFGGELPAGWNGGYSGDPENLRPGVVWRDILSAVDEVRVLWGDPTFFYIGQQFDLGVDNVRIDYVTRPGAELTADPEREAAGADALGDAAPASLAAGEPAGAVLHAARPNPFSGTADIGFSVPRATPVTLDVVDLTGRRVARLADRVFEAGEHAVAWHASDVPAGLYLVRLQTDRTVQVQQAVVTE